MERKELGIEAVLGEMEAHGSVFASFIAQAHKVAAPFDQARLEKAFHDLFAVYRQQVERRVQQEEAASVYRVTRERGPK